MAPLLQHASLRALNTFGVDVQARYLARLTDLNDALAWQRQLPAELPRLVLGGGSNVLFTQDYPGVVLQVALRGRQVVQDDGEQVLLKVAAGEPWHDLVMWTLAQGWGGLENLALIPGTVGAAPIQNIGAYGVELKDRLVSLTVLEFATGEYHTLHAADCAFGYRDSVFKHAWRERGVIVDVTLRLARQPHLHLDYGDIRSELQAMGVDTPTAPAVGQAVVNIRRRKLPDPAVLGNAGSFFKNPVVEATLRNRLLSAHPGLVSYATADGRYKLAAGWLIDQCGWRGARRGAAGVYERQALVLVNHGGARGTEIRALAQAVQDSVQATFGVLLEPEPLML